MSEFFPEAFDDWTGAEQERWLNMVDSSGRPELMNDDDLIAFYDIAFNTPRGDIEGSDRAAIMEALRDYIRENYDFDFNVVYDWGAWREAMGY